MPLPPEPRPVGAMRQADGSVLWRVWAPASETVALVTWSSAEPSERKMRPEGEGYFTHREAEAVEGLRYVFRLSDGGEYPDPASRWQPDGIASPSAVFSPENYRWSDERWPGVAREELVIYELHVGTFTPEGTFEAIIPRLAELAALGVTALEIMPVSQFPGDRDWGYAGVHPFAVQNSYGGPRALQRLVDAAHQHGLAVLLDVVYNHVGPEGNFLGQFGPYFTDRYGTPWGRAINFDGTDSDPVRQFVIDNACYWVREFHIDGLRLDAVHAIYDFSPRHILADLAAAVHAEAVRQRRPVHVIAESNQNDVRIISPPELGGYGLDGVWSDDFHHSVHALLTGERDGYYLDFGQPAQVAKAFGSMFVYDGCYSPFFRRRQGSRVGDRDRTHFVVCLQNHDQVGNHGRGDRLTTLAPAAATRLAAGLLLLSPGVPLLFMGEEYGEERPFPFFCSFLDPELVEAVRRGRREEMLSLKFDAAAASQDPQSPGTFALAKLRWSWPTGSRHAQRRQWYQDLLTARRQWPALRDHQHTSTLLLRGKRSGVGAEAPPLLFLQRGGDAGLLALANLSPERVEFPPVELARRSLLLDSEDARYGGGRNEPFATTTELLPFELLVFGTNEPRP